MRKFFIICLMLTGMISASAQTESSSSKWTVRPTLGLNLSFISASENTSDVLASVKGGAIVNYALKDTWGLRSGIILSSQGGKWSQKVDGGWLSWSLEATENPWYLEIPLDVYYSLQIKNVTLTGFTGFPIQIGLFGDHKIKDGGSGNASVGDTNRSVFDSYNRFALSYNIGIEATWRKFTLGFEYNRHLTNDAKTGGSAHINVCSFSLGYNF